MVHQAWDDIVETLTHFLERRNALWQWRGHKHLALLSSGKISDFYVNLSPLYEDVEMQDQVGLALVQKFFEKNRYDGTVYLNPWIIGPAMGAVGLVQSIARAMSVMWPGVRCGFVEKEGDGLALKRFSLSGDRDPLVILCEDVTTTGGTLAKTREALRASRKGMYFIPGVNLFQPNEPPVCFHRNVLTVVDRRESAVEDGVISLLRFNAHTWDSVDQLPEEMRGCTPVRPKENWKELTEEML